MAQSYFTVREQTKLLKPLSLYYRRYTFNKIGNLFAKQIFMSVPITVEFIGLETVKAVINFEFEGLINH